MKSSGGYVAVTAAVIIGILLTVMVLALSLVSFVSRANVSSAYYKERSRALAGACLEIALLKLAQNGSYGGGEIVSVGSDSCQIFPIVVQSAQKIIKSQGQFQKTVTNLQVEVDGDDLSLISWDEVSNF